MPDHYLSIAAFFRDEAPYLEEWLRFHLSEGVEHFFLYNHGSSDTFLERLAPYIEQGRVTLTDWDIEEKLVAQAAAYNHCLASFGPRSRWIAFIDLDEFLFSPEGQLSEVLREYEAFPGVFVHWQCYGSSGHVQQPAGRVTDNFLQRAKTRWPRNRQGKSIVDPNRARKALGPHFFAYEDNGTAVDEARQALSWQPKARLPRLLARLVCRWLPYFPVDPYAYRGVKPGAVKAERLRINHYVVKSRSEYEWKREKNNRSKKNKKRYTATFFRYHDRNEVLDPILKGRVSGEG